MGCGREDNPRKHLIGNLLFGEMEDHEERENVCSKAIKVLKRTGGEGGPKLLQFCMTVLATIRSCIKYLREKRLLSSVRSCLVCYSEMVIRTRQEISDGEVWYCSLCRSTECIRKKSFCFR